MTDERFVFTAAEKKKLIIIGLVGVVLFVLGVVALMVGSDHDAASHGAEAVGHAAETGGHGAESGQHTGSWITRVYANLWINNVYFAGVALIGIFFVAIQYVTQAGWSAGFKRIPLAFGNWLPIAGILMLVIWLVASHDLFHWTHEELYIEGGPHYDEIIAGKRVYLNTPFFLARTIIYFSLWYLFFRWIRKEMIAEDLDGSPRHWKKLIGISAGFIVIFSVSSSMSAWDWILSIDTHWYSTMIGWYVFASWFVTGLAFITLITIYLKERGYLSIV
ncbi:MAG: quinol:cytochrome C oxidoreductase, partial [Bacteroidetes bacterium]